ncbi:MAG: hypothetical protein Q4G09_00155 [Clostridia bacterium]|nr:hypothetical protein [Clostridia bacterium]
MKKKEYKAVTYGLAYKDYLPILNKKVYQTRECKGYYDFLNDINLLKKTLKKKDGKPSLLSNIWLKRICEMDKEQLFKFVNNYKKYDLNPFEFEPGYDKEKNEILSEEEEL